MESAIEKKETESAEENTFVYLFNELSISSKSTKAHKKPHKVPLKKAHWFKPLLNMDEIKTSYDIAYECKGEKQIYHAHLLLSQLLSAIAITPTNEHYEYLSKTYNMLGTAYGEQHIFYQQIHYCNEAITAAKNVTDKNQQIFLHAKALINVTLAINIQKTDDFESAGFEQAIEMLEKISEPDNEVYHLLLFTYEQILHIYNQMGNLRNAKTEDIPQKALDIFAQIQSHDEKIRDVRNLFEQYYPKAKFFHTYKRKSLEMLDKYELEKEGNGCPAPPSSPS